MQDFTIFEISQFSFLSNFPTNQITKFWLSYKLIGKVGNTDYYSLCSISKSEEFCSYRGDVAFSFTRQFCQNATLPYLLLKGIFPLWLLVKVIKNVLLQSQRKFVKAKHFTSLFSLANFTWFFSWNVALKTWLITNFPLFTFWIPHFLSRVWTKTKLTAILCDNHKMPNF